MTGSFQLTPLAETRPGMVLSDGVRDAKGNVLLANGTVLTDAMLAALARHGIDLLPLQPAAAPVPTQAPVDTAAVQARLDHLFRKHEGADHAVAALRRYVEDYRLQRKVAA